MGIKTKVYSYDYVLFDQIACGSVHSVAITRDNNIKIWGNNFYGQIGNGRISRTVDLHDIFVTMDNRREITEKQRKAERKIS